MEYEEHIPGVFEPKENGDSVEGVLIKIQHEVGQQKKTLYTLENKENVMSVWGTVVLDNRMIGIKVGQPIKIEYIGLGEAQPGKNAPKLFKVYKGKLGKAKEVPGVS
jgi:hypothetical protein